MFGKVIIAVFAARNVASVGRCLRLLGGKSVEFPIVHTVVALLLDKEVAQLGHIHRVARHHIVGGGAVGAVAVLLKEFAPLLVEVVAAARTEPYTKARTIAVGNVAGALQAVGEL